MAWENRSYEQLISTNRSKIYLILHFITKKSERKDILKRQSHCIFREQLTTQRPTKLVFLLLFCFVLFSFFSLSADTRCVKTPVVDPILIPDVWQWSVIKDTLRHADCLDGLAAKDQGRHRVSWTPYLSYLDLIPVSLDLLALLGNLLAPISDSVTSNTISLLSRKRLTFHGLNKHSISRNAIQTL